MKRWPMLVVALLMLYLALPGLPAVAIASEDAGEVLAEEQSDELELHEAHLRLAQYGERPGYAEGQLEAQFLGNLSEEQLKQLATELGEAMRRMDKESGDLSSYRFSEDELITLMEFAVNTQPDLWFTSDSFSYWASANGTVRKVIFSYVADKATIDAMQQRYYTALDSLLAWVPKGASQAEQVKAIHDWLVRNLSYNERAADLGYRNYGVTLEDNP